MKSKYYFQFFIILGLLVGLASFSSYRANADNYINEVSRDPQGDLENAVNDSKDVNYFDPSNKSDYYTSIPKNMRHVILTRAIGISKHLNSLPNVAMLSGTSFYVHKVIRNGGKYRFVISYSENDKNRLYVAANKNMIKFVSNSVFLNLSSIGNPKNRLANGNFSDLYYPEVSVPTIIFNAIQKKYSNKYGNFTSESSTPSYYKDYAKIANYFGHKTIHSAEYYVKRYKKYDKIFKLSGKSSLRAFAKWAKDLKSIYGSSI